MLFAVIVVLAFVLLRRPTRFQPGRMLLVPTGCFLLKPLLTGRPLIEITVVVSCAALLFDELRNTTTPVWQSSMRKLF